MTYEQRNEVSSITADVAKYAVCAIQREYACGVEDVEFPEMSVNDPGKEKRCGIRAQPPRVECYLACTVSWI